MDKRKRERERERERSVNKKIIEKSEIKENVKERKR